jgi:hypothetical protein
MNHLINLCIDNTQIFAILTVMMKYCTSQGMDKTLKNSLRQCLLYHINMSQVKRKVTLRRLMSFIANIIHLYSNFHLLLTSLPLSYI